MPEIVVCVVNREVVVFLVVVVGILGSRQGSTKAKSGTKREKTREGRGLIYVPAATDGEVCGAEGFTYLPT